MTVTLSDQEFGNLCAREKAGEVRIYIFAWSPGKGWNVNYSPAQPNQGELIPLTPNTANK